jgi:gamma-glutamyltranspeptidase/glutathione hydrolase
MPTSLPTAGIATPHPAAAAAGKEMYLQGGNAMDAAVAAMLACCVVEPAMVGLGGYGGSLVGFLSGQTVAIDFDSRAPLGYRPELYERREDYEAGYRSITIPAVIAGLDLALASFGTLPWKDVSAPANRLAEDGVAVTATLRRQLDGWFTKADPGSRRAFLADGVVPDVGSVWRQPDLARLLRRLADNGPASFYHGDVPRAIVRQVQTHGGLLTESDFASYRPLTTAPLTMHYRGFRVLTPPLPSAGVTSLALLIGLDTHALADVEPWSARYFHLVAEAAKYAWDDRASYLGESAPPPAPHTVNISAADNSGNIVSVTATQGYQFGSAVVIDGLGLVMNHGMSRFDLTPASGNAPAPGKHMAHNMAPTIILDKDRRPFAALGLPGGPKIVTVTAQLVVSLIDFHATPEQAVTAGRVHVAPGEPLAVSSAVSDEVIEELRRMGHTVRRGQDIGGPPNEIGGPANVVMIDPATGEITAASQAGPDAATVIGGVSDG